jgi:glycosyltransferase involved in cell wall biosynthesis
MNPRVSVIMNVWNGEKTIRDAMESVLSQTFSDWELIAWDDQSSDNSAAVIKSFGDPRILYFLSNEKKPLGAARNEAIHRARGDWLAFLDQDDVWLPDKLAKQLGLTNGARETQVGFVYGRAVAFGDHMSERDYDHRHEYSMLPEGNIFRNLFVDSCYIAISSLLYRKTLFYEVGGIPPEFMVTPDYYLLVCGAHRYAAKAVQEVICRVRLHRTSMSHSVGEQIQIECLALVKMWAHCLDQPLVSRRRKVHNSVLAYYEILKPRRSAAGWRRLIVSGSIPYLAFRPIAISWRRMRRLIAIPEYKKHIHE